MTGIGSHQQPNEGKTANWLTPPWVIEGLGCWWSFDLDPCAAVDQPWPTAHQQWTSEGLVRPLDGRVWMNPPYGRETGQWLSRLACHGCGTALIFARTETKMFHEQVWGKATALFFFRGRLWFHRPDGSKGRSNAGAPSVLVAYGRSDAERLRKTGFSGVFVNLKV